MDRAYVVRAYTDRAYAGGAFVDGAFIDGAVVVARVGRLGKGLSFKACRPIVLLS